MAAAHLELSGTRKALCSISSNVAKLVSASPPKGVTIKPTLPLHANHKNLPEPPRWPSSKEDSVLSLKQLDMCFDSGKVQTALH